MVWIFYYAEQVAEVLQRDMFEDGKQPPGPPVPMKVPGWRRSPAPGTRRVSKGVAMCQGALQELQTPNHPARVHVLSRCFPIFPFL